MTDRYEAFKTGPISPAFGGFEVTPSDETELTEVPRALYVGSDGAVAVTMQDGTDLTFSGVFAGAILPIRVTHVLATGTTATGIIALI